MENERKIVPEICFPGFDEPWVASRLGDVVSFKVTNSFSRDNLNYENGLVKNIHYGDIHKKFQTQFDITKETVPFINPDIDIQKIKEVNYCQEGDLVFADASEDLADVGKSIEIVNLNNERLVSGLHTILARLNSKLCHTGFLGYLLKTDFIRKQIQKESHGTKVLSISATRLSNLIIHYPLSIIHSKKIASCLSSLDELITAHNDKLEALKDHKKGLMQNLFPREGEKVPKFRFPKFEKDGEWVEKTLIQVADYGNGKAHEKDIDEDGNYVVVNSKFISSEGETIKYSKTAHCPAQQGDILMVLSDVPNGRAIAKCFYVNENNKYSVNQRICKITAFNTDTLFLFYTMDRNSYFLAFDDGVKQTNLRKDDVLDFPFLIPDNIDEQRKISLCISAVDELITAQSEKIEQLQQHKKGLMQGLFPKIV